MIKSIKILVDLDGVLADFAGAVLSRFGIPMEEMSSSQLWKKIKIYNDTVAPWFATLPKMPDADELWDFLLAHFKHVEICTASGSTPRDAGGQKRVWVGNNLGWDVTVNVVGSSSEKAAFASPDVLLIDDMLRSINPFINSGGLAIHHKSASETISILKVMMKDWD